MPVTKSAAKRVRQNLKRHQRNLRLSRSVHRETKALVAAIAKHDSQATRQHFQSAQSALDKAVKKGVIHRNKAARQKSQLARRVKDAKAKPATKPAAKKATTKKPATAKATPKKTTTKKPAK